MSGVRNVTIFAIFVIAFGYCARDANASTPAPYQAASSTNCQANSVLGTQQCMMSLPSTGSDTIGYETASVNCFGVITADVAPIGTAIGLGLPSGGVLEIIAQQVGTSENTYDFVANSVDPMLLLSNNKPQISLSLYGEFSGARMTCTIYARPL